MVSGGIRRFAGAALAAIGAGLTAGFARSTSAGSGSLNVTAADYAGYLATREDRYLGRWSYARKGKRTAAQVKRAARKKRNRARNK